MPFLPILCTICKLISTTIHSEPCVALSFSHVPLSLPVYRHSAWVSYLSDSLLFVTYLLPSHSAAFITMAASPAVPYILQ